MKNKSYRGPYCGEPLFYLLKKEPDHGEGRLLIRGSVIQRPEQPTYYRILNVDLTPVLAKKKRKMRHRDIPQINVIVDKIYLGVMKPKTLSLRTTSHLSDFKLVPKEEENKYLENTLARDQLKNHEGDYNDDEDGQEVDEDGDSDGGGYGEEEAAKHEYINIKQESSEQQETSSSYNNTSRDVNPSPKEQQVVEDTIACSLDKNTTIRNFSGMQMQRIKKMISNGMNSDTAQQLELERQIAFKNAEAKADEKRGLKRAIPSSNYWTNETAGGSRSTKRYK